MHKMMTPSVMADYDNLKLIILDQTQLPGKEVYLSLTDADDMREAIWQLKVRGAPAIGIAAAYGISILMYREPVSSLESYRESFNRYYDILINARPTAVNLANALNRMKAALDRCNEGSKEIWDRILRDEAEAIRSEDAMACRKIGELGLSLLEPSWGILTHCNAGHLAVSEYGTALAPIYLGQQQGYNFKVFADETRPLLQGARLTAYELYKNGVDVTLICDNMASAVMQKGWIQAVLVGCDRIAANGDTANKIGTSAVAILAKHYNIPFYILGPTSTIDINTKEGKDIRIELRPDDEIKSKWYSSPVTPEGVKTYNPSFDVTPAELITAIITEKGIIRPPFTENINKLINASDL